MKRKLIKDQAEDWWSWDQYMLWLFGGPRPNPNLNENRIVKKATTKPASPGSSEEIT